MITIPEIYPKNWGREIWIANHEKYCSKILEVKQGFHCSVHFHKLKDETFFLLTGAVVLELSEKEDFSNPQLHRLGVMNRDQAIRILPFQAHRFTAIDNSQILEVSTQHFEEDSYRISPSGEWDAESWKDYKTFFLYETISSKIGKLITDTSL